MAENTIELTPEESKALRGLLEHKAGNLAEFAKLMFSVENPDARQPNAEQPESLRRRLERIVKGRTGLTAKTANSIAGVLQTDYEGLLRAIRPTLKEAEAVGQPLGAQAHAHLSDADLLQLFSACLGSEADLCWQLVTRGISLGSGADALRLAQVYVNLDTRTARSRGAGESEPGREVQSPLSALEALFDDRARRVVLVGEPGSGKSTFLQFVLLGLTYAHSTDPNKAFNFAGLDGKIPDILRQQQGKWIPLRVILRDFAHNRDAAAPSPAEQVVRYLVSSTRNDRNCPEAADHLVDVLRRGRAFVLFDGLDEVPEAHIAAVKQAIEAFAQGEYQGCRIAVTCRTESYRHSGFKLASFPEAHELAPLPAERQNQFITAWYEELERAQPQFKKGEGATCAGTLIRALDDDRLKEMAGNPFFLTAMAALHRPDKELPHTSAELMDALVWGVLEESRKRQTVPTAASAQAELALLLEGIPDGFKLLRARLEAIAYKTREQRQQDTDSRFVNEDTLRQKLRLTRNVDEAWVTRVLEALRHRAGLLQSKDAVHFEFAYRFEEFLAGCYLANEDAWDVPFEKRARDFFRAHQHDRQVVIWASGFFVHVRHRKGPVRDLITALTPAQPLTAKTDFSLTALELAADIARDAQIEHWQDEDVAYASDTLRRLRIRLEEVRDTDAVYPAVTRARAASAIGRLGDPRPGLGPARDPRGGLVSVDVRGRRIAVPGFVWCGARGEVAPGESEPLQKAFPRLERFKLGEPKGRKDRAWNSFTQFGCSRITRPFFIGKYPVTVAQYQLFVEAGGYEQEALWTPAGQEWRQGHADVAAMYDWLRKEYQKEHFPIARPKDYSAVLQTPNHPRVGVSWFEARAYVAWLNSPEVRPHLVRDLGLPEGCEAEIRLPTEAEWELAARWNRQKGEPDDRLYPWGDENTDADLSERCNWEKTGIGSTSAVGLFPKGHADCGAADLAGNVWEWCQTKLIPDDKDAPNRYNSGAYDADEGDDTRVLRGGAWGSDREYLRAAARNYVHPGPRLDFIGFRVVCVVVSAR